MSENSKSEPETGEDATFDDDAVVAAADEEISTPAAEPARHKSGSGLIAWLALLVALLALAAFAFEFIRDRDPVVETTETDTALADVTSSLQAVRESITTLQQELAAMSETAVARERELAAIERRFNDRLQQIDAQAVRIATVEGSVSSLQGISAGARDTWLLAEAEYYMQIANAQLQLAGNPELAAHALRFADERLLQLGNPALTEVRRVLSDELRALSVMENPDTTGVTLALASLAGVVDSLPLRHEVQRAEPMDDAIDPELSGVDRAMASLRNAVDGVVSVRRTDETVRPLIAPEAQYFLRANLALQLQGARLAVLRGEESIFRQSIDDATEWLDEYYDTESAAVQNAQQTLGDIRDSVFSVDTPDISESLRLLRQFNTLADAEPLPVTEASDDQPAEPEQ